MTLIELIEYYASLIKEGKTRSQARLALDRACVVDRIIEAIVASVNDDGSYRRVKV